MQIKANSVHDDNTRIIPVQGPNQIKSVKKLESGDLEITQYSGNVFTISKDDDLFAAFAVWTMVNDECREAS